MAEKSKLQRYPSSVDAQIADLEAQIVKLKAQKEALEHPPQEYPKAIEVPDPVTPYGVPTKTIVVNNAAEESAARGGRSVQAPGETKAQYDARVRAEAAAARKARKVKK